jgi:hypothetical protein
MFDIWIRAITRPRLDTYEAFLQEEPNPTLGKAAAWMAVAAAIGWVISVVLTAVFGAGLIQFDIITLVCGIVAAPIGAVIGFVIGSAILLVAAKLFGGDGTFVHQSYLLAAAYAPMSIISTAVVALPVVGLVLGLAASLYSLWLAVVALQAAHSYSRGRAVLTVLAPTLLVFVPICLIAILLLIGPAVGNVFSTIVEGI